MFTACQHCACFYTLLRLVLLISYEIGTTLVPSTEEKPKGFRGQVPLLALYSGCRCYISSIKTFKDGLHAAHFLTVVYHRELNQTNARIVSRAGICLKQRSKCRRLHSVFFFTLEVTLLVSISLAVK